MKKIKIMGVLNLTPDSFYDGSPNLLTSKSSLINQLNKLKDADIIDVGCESSQPGSFPVSDKEEIKRLSGCVNIIKTYTNIFSIDTYKYNVAKYALNNGFKMINDIYAGRYQNNKIFELVSNFNVPIVLMHMQGNPSNMHKETNYKSIIDDILYFFESRIREAKSYGIPDNNIIIDPGIGFGKNIDDNFKIIKNINKFKELGFQVLIGLSRKKFLMYKENLPKDRLPATIGMNAIAIANGANILRVHDVLETASMATVLSKYDNCSEGI